MTASTDAALLLQHRQAVAELQEQLTAALAYIDRLEGELQARRRNERDSRTARAIDYQRPRRPRITKPLRPSTDEEWAKTLADAHTRP
jgi:hypothetical protein